MRNIKKLVLAILVLVTLFNVGCSSSHDFEHQVNVAVKPYRFSIAGWEVNTFFTEIKQLFHQPVKNAQTDTEITNEYISLGHQIQDLKNKINAANQADVQNQINGLQQQQNNLTPAVEKIIERQTTQVLTEMGIYQPWYKHIKLKFTFPAPDFKLETPPHLLVISPRDKIATIKTIFLSPNLSTDQMSSIEADVDKLNVSSLVVDLGGIATYPDIVASDSDFQYIIDTCAHEWTHAYLAFTPLGFRYILNIAGLSHNADITTMNETVADMVGKEVGDAVIEKYYPQLQTNSQNTQSVNPPAFDFNKEMHAIRVQVDQYLAAGEINVAEQYMDQERDYLEANGYYIRKLNQAFFAFNGNYADTPAFENTIGTQLSRLRADSNTLKDFLNTVSSFTNLQSLESALKQK